MTPVDFGPGGAAGAAGCAVTVASWVTVAVAVSVTVGAAAPAGALCVTVTVGAGDVFADDAAEADVGVLFFQALPIPTPISSATTPLVMDAMSCSAFASYGTTFPYMSAPAKYCS